MANNQYILLVDEDGGRTVRAGDNFQWTPYPKTIEMDGRTWEYFFCADGVPHYRQVGMAAKPATFMLEQPRHSDLAPGVSLQFHRGPYKIIRVYPFYPTGRASEYRRSVEIEGPFGEHVVVSDEFVERWMTVGR